MEHSHKNTDCYFFYYSTCTKGDNCPFRHEPSALGCETMCVYWKQGKCFDEHCNFRHMELRKNRKSIPCYWETQPGGCRKPHCSFMHKNARTITNDPINPVKNFDLTSKTMNQEWSNRQDDTKYDGSSTESDQGRGSSEAGSFIGSPAVDPLIVKFEEESDNESVPSPVKPQPRVPYCKTYEEIRLEEIQAESAAYYSYQAEGTRSDIDDGSTKSRRMKRICLYPAARDKDSNDRKGLDFQVLTLDEIRRRKRSSLEGGDDKTRENSEPAASSTELSKENTVAESCLTETIAEAISARGMKRRLENFEQDTSKRRRKISCPINHDRNAISSSSVPPVKLRRSPKRSSSSSSLLHAEERDARADEEQQLEAKNRDESGRNSPESSSTVRLNESESSSSTGRPRKNDVEVRLCDSSTDEDQTPLERKKQKSLQLVDSVEDSKEADSLLNVNEEDYLTLDMASDDILNDIDALLKDKTSVWRKG